MATISFVENYYSYRRPSFISKIGAAASATPDAAALVQIETLLNQAATDYAARRYQTAIGEYQQAESLIYQHLDPTFDGGNTIAFPHDPALFDPLLSASIEWLNKLAPVAPAIPVVSRLPVDHTLLGAAGNFEATGLRTAVLRAATVAAPAASAAAGVLNAPERPIGTLPPPPPPPPAPTRSIGLVIAGKVTPISWAAGAAPPIDTVRQTLFANRVSIANLSDLVVAAQQPSDVATQLPHDYFFVIPVGLADCYRQIGDYAAAEQRYLQATTYKYLNTPVEVPFLWLRLAQLYLDWGNSMFRQDAPTDALPIFEKVVVHDATVPPAAALYTTAALAPAVNAARQVITALKQIVAGQTDATKLNVNPLIAAAIVAVYQQELKIAAGLDFLGMPTNTVPIWTFDYLQEVAANFAQLAMSAERDVITFWDRADQSTLERDQLSQAVTQAGAQVNAAQLQAIAASFTASAYQDGQILAQQRAADAQANATEYASQSWSASLYQAVGAQVAGGDDGNFDQLNTLADEIMAGSGESGISRSTLAAADQLAAARTSNQFEIDSMQRDANELQTAATQAATEAAAAAVASAAMQANLVVAQLQQAAATQNLAAFDSQTFTPGVWHQMGEAMLGIYQRYMDMALRTARLMQQAYNFETDQTLHWIKTSYATAEVQGLLGADALMADIQSFTYDMVTGQKTKPQPIRQTISLATRYAFEFENQFRKTGEMAFETRIEDFDAYYPGTYAGRIQAIEVELDGIVPVSGVSGTLTNSGISAYRLPSNLWTNPTGTGLKYRVQPRETLVISDYAVRQDGLLEPQDSRKLGIFQGAGVASPWVLSVPKSINDIDYGALTDVRITFYYQARFDPNLRDRVLAQLASRPGINVRQRALPMRWLYPDAFFGFRRSGTLTVALQASDFRANETKPVLTNIGVLITTNGTEPASGISVSLATPGQPAAVVATTDATGGFMSAAGNAWAPLAAGSAIGNYAISVPLAGNAALAKAGALDLSPIVNLTLLFSYSFTPKS